MFKIMKKKNKLFPTCVLFFLACPLLEGNFPNRTGTFCPLMRGVRYFCQLLEVFYKGFVLILTGLLTSFRHLEVYDIRVIR